jgi:predicted DNA-binding ribbon-helix-helix protein
MGAGTASINLEQPFLVCLDDIAAERRVSLRKLIVGIVGQHCADIASTLRVHALRHICQQAGLPLELTASLGACKRGKKYH